MIVLVDARNVLRSEWPNIPEEELVDLCRAWAAATERRIVVVFDGKAPGGLVGEREFGDECVLVGTGRDETADEWLERAASEFAERNETFWLVTSDRALRGAAGEHAERTIGGGSFARELRSRNRAT